MPGEIGDGEHFIAQGRNKKQINLREDAGHFFGHFASKAVGLYEINGGKETSLPEEVGPGVMRLDFELIDAVREREFFESGSAFREKNEIERVVGPVRQSELDRSESDTLAASTLARSTAVAGG